MPIDSTANLKSTIQTLIEKKLALLGPEDVIPFSEGAENVIAQTQYPLLLSSSRKAAAPLVSKPGAVDYAFQR